MSRGFLAGAGWGTVVAGVGLVVASQVVDLTPAQHALRPSDSDVVSVPAESTTDLTSRAAEPEPDVSAPGVTETAVPETTLPATAAPAPAAEPAMQVPQPVDADLAPTLSQPDGAPVAQPVLPNDVAGTDVSSAPTGVVSEPVDDAPLAASSVPAPPEAQTVMTVPDAPNVAIADLDVPAVSDPNDVDLVETARDLPEGVAPDDAPMTPSNPEMVTDDANPPIAELPAAVNDFVIDPNLNAVPPATPESVPDIEADSVTNEEAPVTRPIPGFTAPVDGVKTGRLPSIGGEPAAGPSVLDQDPTESENASLPPVERYARAFTNTAGKPIFAILLQDTGGPEVDREALAAIPFPVSFVIDPTLPDAATAAAIYRAAGQEVLMLASGIPAQANARDLAVSFEAMSAALPDAVAVVDLENGGFQGNRSLATEVIALVQDQGRGIISWDRGLNAASQVARRDGVKNATIFRALDAADESSPVIQRYLDRAAFKAAQDGRVVVSGHTRPETVTALLEWAVEGRAATVAIAPATAAMTSQ